MSVSPAVGVIHSECVASSTSTVSVSQPGLDLGLIGHIREPHSLPRQDTKVLTFYFLFHSSSSWKPSCLCISFIVRNSTPRSPSADQNLASRHPTHLPAALLPSPPEGLPWILCPVLSFLGWVPSCPQPRGPPGCLSPTILVRSLLSDP